MFMFIFMFMLVDLDTDMDMDSYVDMNVTMDLDVIKLSSTATFGLLQEIANDTKVPKKIICKEVSCALICFNPKLTGV